MDYNMALLINQGPRYGCKRRGARREWITWQHRDVRLVVLVFRQTARRPDTRPERTKGRVPKRQWPMTNNEWPEHSMCGVLMAASNPTFFLKEVRHVISWRSYGILWCSLIEQFHQPRLVICTFHRQGRCSRGGHLCNEHSEEKYSCSYK